MIDGKAILVQQELYMDLRRQAESDRLIRQARAGREKGERFSRRALAWLGCQLVAWGQQLEGHYRNAPLAPKALAGQSR